MHGAWERIAPDHSGGGFLGRHMSTCRHMYDVVRYVLQQQDAELYAPGCERADVLELEELLDTALPQRVYVARVCSDSADLESHWPDPESEALAEALVD
jgi:hypothetical protein